MATPKDKLNEKIKFLNNFEVIEALDFIEYLEQKRTSEIKKALVNASEIDEPLTDEELKVVKDAEEDFKNGRTLSYKEVFGEDD